MCCAYPNNYHGYRRAYLGKINNNINEIKERFWLFIIFSNQNKITEPFFSFQSDDNASFLRAARGGNLEKVLEYLKANTDINTCNAVSFFDQIENIV